jgi:hypothetical protein
MSKSSASASAACAIEGADALGYLISPADGGDDAAVRGFAARPVALNNASTSASISARVLYIASETRAVDGMPSRSIAGWQQ